jgi:uncharacterized protein YbjQ (UPF0145 family)
LSNDDKKDLTRIEDLGEFLHELNNENESFEVEEEAQGLSGLPDVPSDDFEQDPPAFGEEEEALAFDDSPSFEISSEEDSFSLSESEEASPFESDSETDFSSDFSQGTEEPSFDSEEPAWGENTTDDTLASFDESQFETAVAEGPISEEIEEIEEIQEAPVSSFFSSTQEEFKEHKTENFDDVKKFAEQSTYSNTSAEANPSFSVLIRNVRFAEDANDIAILLNDLKVVENSEDAKKSLSRGSLLVPRVSEFAAVFIAHKLRRFDADILVGLSDDIHPPKYKDDAETGLVSKQHLYQNQAHAFDFSRPKIDLSSIIISTAPQLDQFQILRYLGVASEHMVLDSAVVEDESSSKIQFHYEELAHKLKAHAVKQNANAVIGINYHLTPLPSEFSMGPARYKLACTGNLVWVNRL